ncbi:MAG: YpdA family putative bacillithiol disulfide reductase [Luteitalea sp.]|nr:YpdA family putative bacillithiol disulfide reductase [Luteitalea sp.]
MQLYDIVVVGAGPAGLATAIAAKQRGLSALVLEKDVLVNTLLHFPVNMIYFTTPELMEIGGLPFVTPYEKPTRVEALRYYRRAVETYDLAIQYNERVTAVVRAGNDGDVPFAVRTETPEGRIHEYAGRFVVIATGAFDLPNMMGVPGEELPHVSHYYTEAHPYFKKRVAIVGGANSAADAALDLYRSGADVTLVHRGQSFSDSLKYWVRPDLENRIKDGAIKARLGARLIEIRPKEVLIEDGSGPHVLPADVVLLLTGYRSDTTLFAAAGVEFDPETSVPVFDAETFETNVPGVFLAGAVITGRNSGKIFIENGRFHGAQVVRIIHDRLRMEVADSVQA